MSVGSCEDNPRPSARLGHSPQWESNPHTTLTRLAVGLQGELAPDPDSAESLTGVPPGPYVSRSYRGVIAPRTYQAEFNHPPFTPVLGQRSGIEPALFPPVGVEPTQHPVRGGSPVGLRGEPTAWGPSLRSAGPAPADPDLRRGARLPRGISQGLVATKASTVHTAHWASTDTRPRVISPRLDRSCSG